MMKKWILIVAAIVIVGTAGVGLWYYTALKSNCVVRDGEVYVHTGSTYADLVDQLTHGGNIKSMSRFQRAARISNLDTEGVRPGRYVLKSPMGYRAAARMFRYGYQTPVRLTFNNIRLLPQLAGRVSTQIEADSVSLAAALLADTTAARYGFDDRTFIAMFIPDTYEIYWTATPDSFVAKMHKEWEKFWTEERVAKLARTELTKIEAVTLASIVYEETKMRDEMPTVAGVYINRLRIGMPLQADPTVRFAAGDFTIKRVLDRHKEIDSPYNTYKIAGLPPGPICMPSVVAIDAVLDYRSHDYLYFCARPDFSGYHNFSTTLAQHNRNAAEYHHALNARGIK